ncbi:MAG TPA: prepilin peptidase [Candidatus Acidoferrum sp.]
MIPFFVFLIGICIGSFLNVCISRIPEGLSIVRPASRCPECGTPIKPYDNIPVFGWLFLRGKCRSCGHPISPMYPIVELSTGLLFLVNWLTFGFTLASFKFLLFGCLLIILMVTDLRVRMLPDAVNWFGFGLGLAFATRVPADGFADMWIRDRALPTMLIGVIDAMLGAVFASLLLWGAAALYKFARKREGMGMGDVKMMAMAGAFLGVRGAFLMILIGTLLGSVLGLTLVLALYVIGWRRRLAVRAHRRGLGTVAAMRWAIAARYQLPLGTFLGIAGLLVVYVLPRYGFALFPRIQA